MVHVAVAKLHALCAREPDSVDDAGMITFVGQNRIMPLDESGQDADVRGVTAAEIQRRSGAFEAGKVIFSLRERRPVAAQQTRCRGATSFLKNGSGHALFQ